MLNKAKSSVENNTVEQNKAFAHIAISIFHVY